MGHIINFSIRNSAAKAHQELGIDKVIVIPHCILSALSYLKYGAGEELGTNIGFWMPYLGVVYEYGKADHVFAYTDNLNAVTRKGMIDSNARYIFYSREMRKGGFFTSDTELLFDGIIDPIWAALRTLDAFKNRKKTSVDNKGVQLYNGGNLFYYLYKEGY